MIRNGMLEHAPTRLDRRRGADRRRTTPARLQRTELGRLHSAIRALARVHRERDDQVDAEIAELRRDVDRILLAVGLEQLPPVDDA